MKTCNKYNLCRQLVFMFRVRDRLTRIPNSLSRSQTNNSFVQFFLCTLAPRFIRILQFDLNTTQIKSLFFSFGFCNYSSFFQATASYHYLQREACLISDKGKMSLVEFYVHYNFTRLIHHSRFMLSDLFFINLI